MNSDLFSTREVAAALAVSESSVRRWCDQGKLKSVRTAGGHRKLPMESILQFVRATGHAVVRSDILGIAHCRRESDLAVVATELAAGLKTDDAVLCHRLITSAYAEGRSVVEICDELIGPAMSAIGDAWESGEIGVDQERRSCQIVLKALVEIENHLPVASADAPTALGGTPEGDFAQIGTKMAELVLRDSGWNARQIGAGMPLRSLPPPAGANRPTCCGSASST